MQTSVKTILALLLLALCFTVGVWAERNLLSTAAAAAATEERNRAAVLRYMQAFINQRDMNALDEVMVADWIAHNPAEGNGRDALKELAAGWFQQFPQLHADVKRVFADGDFVVTHTHYTVNAQDRGNDWAPGSAATVDIFRLEDGKIVEHWDVVQRPIPEESVNGNSMFDGGGVYNYR